MTQTHPTSEVAALVPTGGGGDPFAVLSSCPIHPLLKLFSSTKKKSFFLWA